MKHSLENVEMHSTKQEKSEMEAVPSKMEYRPTVYFSTKDLPELGEKDVGDECYIVQKVKVVGISERKDFKGKSKKNYDLEVHEVGILDYEE